VALFIDQAQIEQTIEDIASARPRVTRLTTYEATCTQCGQSVRSSHPLQMSLATGAAGVQLGPRALALAADLNKGKGLSMRKTCAILGDCFSLQLSAGGLSQALDRLAPKSNPNTTPSPKNCAKHRWFIVTRPAWVGGPGWWLWVFVNPCSTLYIVAQSRGSCVVTELLGIDFGGVALRD
jgi:transposase